MNIETANKLVNLRKKNNLSQEELANKLGISRQAVSKWERAEAAPDTDNLVKLARLYKISLDELLLSDIELMKEIDQEIENPDLNKEEYNITNDEYNIKIIKGNKEISIKSLYDDRENNIPKVIYVKRYIRVIISTICIIAFLLLGFLTTKWHIAWIVLLGIPLFDSIFLAISAKKAKYFNYPILATIIFFLLSFLYNLWNYAWIIFITIPLYYAIVGSFKRTIYIDEKIR